MSKIISKTSDTVTIKDENKEREIPRVFFNFEPNVGDEVEMYKSGGNIAILKIDPNAVAGSKKKSSLSTGFFAIVKKIASIFKPEGREVNKIFYVIVAIIAGSFGAHHFYAGRVTIGIVYAVLSFFGGITTILTIIDIIRAILKPRNQNNKIVV